MKSFPREMQHDSGVPMTMDATRVLIGLKEEIPSGDLQSRLDALSLALEEGAESGTDDPGHPTHSTMINHTRDRYWVHDRQQKVIDDKRFDAIEASLADVLAWIGPVYQLSTVHGAGGRLRRCRMCCLFDSQGLRLRESAFGDHQIYSRPAAIKENREKSVYLMPFHYYEIEDPHSQNAYEIRQGSKEDHAVEVLFENYAEVVPTTIAPNDTLLGSNRE